MFPINFKISQKPKQICYALTEIQHMDIHTQTASLNCRNNEWFSGVDDEQAFDFAISPSSNFLKSFGWIKEKKRNQLIKH